MEIKDFQKEHDEYFKLKISEKVDSSKTEFFDFNFRQTDIRNPFKSQNNEMVIPNLVYEKNMYIDELGSSPTSPTFSSNITPSSLSSPITVCTSCSSVGTKNAYLRDEYSGGESNELKNLNLSSHRLSNLENSNYKFFQLYMSLQEKNYCLENEIKEKNIWIQNKDEKLNFYGCYVKKLKNEIKKQRRDFSKEIQYLKKLFESVKNEITETSDDDIDNTFLKNDTEWYKYSLHSLKKRNKVLKTMIELEKSLKHILIDQLESFRITFDDQFLNKNKKIHIDDDYLYMSFNNESVECNNTFGNLNFDNKKKTNNSVNFELNFNNLKDSDYSTNYEQLNLDSPFNRLNNDLNIDMKKNVTIDNFFSKSNTIRGSYNQSFEKFEQNNSSSVSAEFTNKDLNKEVVLSPFKLFRSNSRFNKLSRNSNNKSYFLESCSSNDFFLFNDNKVQFLDTKTKNIFINLTNLKFDSFNNFFRKSFSNSFFFNSTFDLFNDLLINEKKSLKNKNQELQKEVKLLKICINLLKKNFSHLLKHHLFKDKLNTL